MAESRYYRVSRDPYDAPIADFLQHGYEERRAFFRAVSQLCQRWHDRVGECIGQRHGFSFLRFHDTPGGRPDEAWIPDYLLKPADAPPCVGSAAGEPDDSMIAELDDAFGFD